MQYWNNVKFELDISKILFLLGIISSVFYFLFKKWRNILSKIMVFTFGISLLLNLYAVFEYYKIIQTQNTIAEYDKLKTCEKMENRFSTDLKNNEIKYFQFGIGTDLELQKTLKNKFGIKSYGMGCIIQSEFECYNELVYKYLKEVHNKSINDIYKEIDTE